MLPSHADSTRVDLSTLALEIGCSTSSCKNAPSQIDRMGPKRLRKDEVCSPVPVGLAGQAASGTQPCATLFQSAMPFGDLSPS
eukprot:4608339-Amphidinium_carterae.1